MNHNNNQNARNFSSLNPNPHRDGARIPGAVLEFSLEALAPCLADLKKQLELRQAMH